MPDLLGLGLVDPAVRAQPEQLEAVVVDAIAGRPLEVADDVAKAGVRDIAATAASRTNDVVVMGRFASDVGVVAAWQIEPLDRAEAGEDVQGSEDRGAPDPEPLRARLGHQVGRGEMGRLIGDQSSNGAPGLRQAVALAFERDEERIGIDHGRTIPVATGFVETESQVDLKRSSHDAARRPCRAYCPDGTIVPLESAPEPRKLTRKSGAARRSEDRMAIQILRGKAGRAVTGPAPEPVAIGEDDSEIFSCPTCERPLATGVSRCPGCRTHLVRGVPLRRVVARGGLALIIALAIGGGVIGAVILIQNVVAGGLPPTSASASAGGAAPVATVDPAVPMRARSGLHQTSLINQRLANDAGKLAVALAARQPVAADIAHALRTIAADATFGASVARDVAAWPDGAALSEKLAAFYDSVGASAVRGLDASITNRAAYMTAGRRMLVVVGELRAIDAASQALAASIHFALDPVTLPRSVARP